MAVSQIPLCRHLPAKAHNIHNLWIVVTNPPEISILLQTTDHQLDETYSVKTKFSMLEFRPGIRKVNVKSQNRTIIKIAVQNLKGVIEHEPHIGKPQPIRLKTAFLNPLIADIDTDKITLRSGGRESCQKMPITAPNFNSWCSRLRKEGINSKRNRCTKK